MSNVTSTIEKLEVIKELAPEASVKQVCDVLIKHLLTNGKDSMGFKNEETA